MKKLILLLFASSMIVACSSSEKKSEENEAMDEASAVTPEFNLTKSTLTWTAFKTPDKIGVSGTFKDIQLDNNHFTINTKSVNSGNEERDGKLVKFFFDNLSDSLITGNYGGVDLMTGKIPVTIKMNGMEKTFDFDYAENDSSSVVSGSIDIVSDFSGSKSLDAIHEACKELHLGKTWSDVSLKVTSMK